MASPDALSLVIARKLSSPNATRGHHWRVRHRERMEWEQDLLVVFMRHQQRDGPRVRAWSLVTGERLVKGRGGKLAVKQQLRPERRRVTIVREVPTGRNLIRDADNRAFAAKGLVDALKAVGLIYEDSDAWLERVVREEVTGRYAVRIVIERLDLCKGEGHGDCGRAPR